MRIVYIYREYFNRRKKYGEIMTQLGHEVKYIEVKNKRTPNQVSLKAISSFKPDLVWLLSAFYVKNKVLSPKVMDYIKSKKILLAFYGTLDTQTPYNKDTFWNQFDFCFVQNKQLYNYLKVLGLNAHYIPLGFHPDQYFPTNKSIEKPISISFAGHAQTYVRGAKNDKRVTYIKALESFGIKTFGKKFDKKGVKSSNYSKHKQQRAIYNRSKINLDLPFINSPLDFYKNVYHIKNRFFEIPATNNFLMTVRCPEFTDIFDESMVGYFEDNIKSIKHEVERYLKDKNLREKKTKLAYKETVNKHTFYLRFKKMFEIIRGS